MNPTTKHILSWYLLTNQKQKESIIQDTSSHEEQRYISQ